MPRRTPEFLRSLLLLLLLLAGLAAPAPRTHGQQSAFPDKRWVSPTWGYVIRWHSNEWTVAVDESVGGADTLTLTDSLGNTVSFTGQAGEAGDAVACLDQMVQAAQDTPGAVDFAIAQDEAGNPYEWSSPEQAWVLFLIRVPSDEGALQDFVGYAECQTLAPGKAVFQRSYSGPPEVFEQWYDDIVKTLEGVYLPSSAWLPDVEGDPYFSVSAGAAPLLGQERLNAAYLLDAAVRPLLLIGMELEAGDTRAVTFENVSADDVTVSPHDVSLTRYSITEEEDQEWPLSAARWEDGAATAGDGDRTLAPGARATVLLDFVPEDLATVSCEDLQFLALEYRPPDGTSVEFAYSDLPARSMGCPPLFELLAAGRPVLQPAPAVDVTHEPIVGVEREALILATPGQLDEFGRIPLARLSFAPGAALPDEFLHGPLVAAVESGAVEVQLGETVVALLGGQMILADEEAVLAARNSSDDVPGTILVLPLTARDGWGIPLEESPPPGVGFDFLFPEQDLLKRLSPQQFIVDRVVLSPGAIIDARDRASPAPEYTALLVVSGSVIVSGAEDAAGEGHVVTAGGTMRVPAGALVEAAASQPAELLLVDVISADQSAAQSNGAADASYTSPTWGYTIHWDAAVWSMEQETSENGTDLLTLRDDAGNIASFMGNSGYGGNATACLESMKASVWQIPGASDFALTMNELNEPFELRGPTQAYAFYQVQLPDGAGGWRNPSSTMNARRFILTWPSSNAAIPALPRPTGSGRTRSSTRWRACSCPRRPGLPRRSRLTQASSTSRPVSRHCAGK